VEKRCPVRSRERHTFFLFEAKRDEENFFRSYVITVVFSLNLHLGETFKLQSENMRNERKKKRNTFFCSEAKRENRKRKTLLFFGSEAKQENMKRNDTYWSKTKQNICRFLLILYEVKNVKPKVAKNILTFSIPEAKRMRNRSRFASLRAKEYMYEAKPAHPVINTTSS
jgi:hypothetical protein